MEIKRIILDANVLIEAAKNKIDIFGQIKNTFPRVEITTSRSVMAEVKKISAGRGKAALAARVALELAKKNSIKAAKTKTTGDSSLLELCGENSALITQDKELRHKCAEKGFQAGYLRGKRYLTFEGEIR
ncbi:MAG: hypothetical protein HY516_02500 [Candidatus Aenigmarchaeota archaeon]|nr:hypothetical protein [Candidatus Aenigmarchaeota archaeon]